MIYLQNISRFLLSNIDQLGSRGWIWINHDRQDYLLIRK